MDLPIPILNRKPVPDQFVFRQTEAGSSDPAPCRQARVPLSADHEVIQQTHIDQCQGLFHACHYRSVCRGGFQVSRGVVVEGEDGAGIQCQCPLGDLSQINFTAVDGAPKQGFDGQYLMLGVKKDGPLPAQ